jgi:hypothetical protein
MLPLLAILIAAIIGSAVGFGFSMVSNWISSTTYSDTKMSVDIDVEPSTEIEMFDSVKLKVKVKAECPFFNYAKYKWEWITLDFVTATVEAIFPGTYTGSVFTITSHLGEGETIFPVVLPVGARSLQVSIKNAKFKHPIWKDVGPFEYTTTIPFTIKRPAGKIDVTFTPEVPRVGEKVNVVGHIKLEKKTLKDLEAYCRDSVVEVYMDGKKITECPINIEDQTFSFSFVPTEPGTKTFLFNIKAVETYAYIGVWASLSLTFTTTGKLEVTPSTLLITSISPQTIYEGDLIQVNCLTEPYKVLVLYFDDTSVDRQSSNFSGRATLSVPSKYAKAGTHVIRVQREDLKDVFATQNISVLAKPPEVIPKVTVTSTLSDRSLPKGGTYITFIDAMEDSNFIPFHLLTEIGDIKTFERDVPKGRAAIRYNFPKGVYPEKIVIPIVQYVTAKGKVYKFAGEITLGG